MNAVKRNPEAKSFMPFHDPLCANLQEGVNLTIKYLENLEKKLQDAKPAAGWINLYQVATTWWTPVITWWIPMITEETDHQGKTSVISVLKRVITAECPLNAN